MPISAFSLKALTNTTITRYNTFSSSTKFLYVPLCYVILPQTSRSWQPLNCFLSLQMNFSCYRISYRWNHTVYAPFSLFLFFAQHYITFRDEKKMVCQCEPRFRDREVKGEFKNFTGTSNIDQRRGTGEIIQDR